MQGGCGLEMYDDLSLDRRYVMLGPQRKILVVDEDEQIAYLLDYLLSREGFQVTTVTNQDQANKLIHQTEPPQVVFMGDMVSYANNNSLISYIRELQRWKQVPIIIMAANYIKGDITQALDAGATDFIVQPFNSAELVAQIERHSQGPGLQ